MLLPRGHKISCTTHPADGAAAARRRRGRDGAVGARVVRDIERCPRGAARRSRAVPTAAAASGRSAVGRVCGAGNLVPPGEQHRDTAAPLHREPQPTL